MSKTNQGVTQNYWVAPQVEPLTFRTPFIENESLTSWIIRSAFNQYCTPSGFTYYYWSDVDLRIWNQDIDKGFETTAPRVSKDIARLADCDESEVTQHTLVSFAKKINSNVYSRISPTWTTPLSKRSAYSRIGYPYCADCMSDDEQAHLSLLWRYSWFVCCIKHKRFLQNQCSHCLYPYQPQFIPLKVGKINRCHHCHRKIDTKIREHDKAPSGLLMEYQQTAYKVYQNVTGTAFGITVTTEVWFETLLFLINMTRKAFSNIEYMFAKVMISLDVIHKDIDFIKPKSGLPFDALSVQERKCLLEHAYQLIEIPYSKWEIALADNKVTQNSFDWSKNNKIPSSFEPLYSKLSRNVKQKRKTKRTTVKATSPDVVSNQWKRLKRKIEMEKYYDSHKREIASRSV